MSQGQAQRQSYDGSQLHDDQSPKLRRHQSKRSNGRSVIHSLAISPDKIEFLKERTSARHSLIKLLNKQGFTVSFDFELSKVKIETESDRDTAEALKFMDDHIVEMDLPLGIELPPVMESLQAQILEDDGLEMMIRPDKQRRSLKVVGLYESTQSVKHSINTNTCLNDQPLTTPNQDGEKGRNTPTEKYIVYERNDRRHGDIGACAAPEEDGRGRHSKAEKDRLYERSDNPDTDHGAPSQSTASAAPQVNMVPTSHCQGDAVVNELPTQAYDEGNKNKCDVQCTPTRSSPVRTNKVSETVLAGEIQDNEKTYTAYNMSQGQGQRQSYDGSQLHDDQSPKLRRHQSKRSNVRSVIHSLAISPDKIEFLKERTSARHSLIKLLNKQGFTVSFDFELLKVKIETESDRDTAEALKIMDDHIVEMDLPLGIELPPVMENLQAQILEDDGLEVMIRPDKQRRSLKVVGLYESTQSVKHSINTNTCLNDQPLTTPNQDGEKGRNTPTEKYIVYERNDNRHGDPGACAAPEEDGRGRHSKAEKDRLYERSDNPDTDQGASAQSTASAAPQDNMVPTSHCQGGAVLNELPTQAHDEGNKNKCDVQCTPTRSSPVRTNKVSVTVLTGEIQANEARADVIVNSSNLKLNLEVGTGVSAGILMAAGGGIQKELNKRYPDGIKTGEVAKSGPGNIHACKAIYHGVLSMFPKDKSSQYACHKALVMVVLNTLLMASSDGYTSVAFPALGTGNLGYPVQEVVQLMFLAVSQFFDCAVSSIQKVFFVIYPKADPLLRQLFLMENFSRRFRTVKVDSPTAAHEKREKDPAKMCETRFEIGKRCLQISYGDVKAVCDVANVVLILWNQDHLNRNKHPVVSCFDETVEQKIYSDIVHLLEQRDTKFVVDTTSFMNTCLIHLYCKDNNDDVIARAIARGIKQVEDDMATIAIPVKSDGSRTWQPHVAAKIIAKALQIQDMKSLHHVVRVILQDSGHLVPFLTSMKETTCKVQQVPNVAHVFDPSFPLSNSRVPIADSAVTLRSRTETPTDDVAKVAMELKRRFGVTLMYTGKDTLKEVIPLGRHPAGPDSNEIFTPRHS